MCDQNGIEELEILWSEVQMVPCIVVAPSRRPNILRVPVTNEH